MGSFFLLVVSAAASTPWMFSFLEHDPEFFPVGVILADCFFVYVECSISSTFLQALISFLLLYLVYGWCLPPFGWVFFYFQSPYHPSHKFSVLTDFLLCCWFLYLYLELISLLWTWPSRSHLLLLEVGFAFLVWHFNCFSGFWPLEYTVLPCLFACPVISVPAADLFCISGCS